MSKKDLRKLLSACEKPRNKWDLLRVASKPLFQWSGDDRDIMMAAIQQGLTEVHLGGEWRPCKAGHEPDLDLCYRIPYGTPMPEIDREDLTPLLDRLEAAGVPVESYNSDLYFQIIPTSQMIWDEYCKEVQAEKGFTPYGRTFSCRKEGGGGGCMMWMDVPGEYYPYFEKLIERWKAAQEPLEK